VAGKKWPDEEIILEETNWSSGHFCRPKSMFFTKNKKINRLD